MPDRRHPGKTHSVLQGESHISADPLERITTILGSCVSVCLFDPLKKIGGMNHFLLPSGTEDGCGSNRYGIHAMERLINQLIKAGGNKCLFQAKAFGGARMTDGLSDIGASNAEFAKRFLSKEGISCIDHDFGGRQARRVFFFPTTGRAEVHVVADLPDLTAPTSAVTVPRTDITLI